VADPPRAGLGAELAGRLSKRAKELFVYVSCDPATLARDLPAVLAEGFVVRRARLYDLFAFTHRVEALVSLERAV
jgi:tRNA/tmRNA/rRNA uracil-C5-methylase (TrmA/RlmC/RlmD family)